MSPDPPALPPHLKALAASFTRASLLARAAELARGGHALAAESILAPGGRLPGDPEALDLLARIAAQQGSYEEAILRWKLAAEACPEDSSFTAAIDAAAEMLAKLSPFQRLVRKLKRRGRFVRASLN